MVIQTASTTTIPSAYITQLSQVSSEEKGEVKVREEVMTLSVTLTLDEVQKKPQGQVFLQPKLSLCLQIHSA